jgi:hypothetical protein
VYAVGLSYSFPWLSFDLGYSFHDYDDRGGGSGGSQLPGSADAGGGVVFD